MNAAPPAADARTRRLNLRTFGKLAIAAVAMFGFGYAMIPIYKSICEATGANSLTKRDEDAAAWDEAANVRIEVICPRTLAEDVLRHLQVRYYANYSMVTFLTEIEVLRPDKF